MSTLDPLPVPGLLDAVITEQWRVLGRPGTWMNGDALVATAELALAGATDDVEQSRPVRVDPVARLPGCG